MTKLCKVLCLLSVLIHFGSMQAQDTLQRLSYNHPGLVVDLGVGLWAWPIPCDADGDGDFDLLVSCPDKPYNGVWMFENPTPAGSANKLPVFKPGRRLSGTVHYVMPSYIGDSLRVLSPGVEYRDFTRTGTEQKSILPIPAKFYIPEGKQPKGPKVRHNQWRLVDFDGNGALDLVVGIEDWSYYGWDDAWDEQGKWTNGPLHGFVLWFRNTGTTEQPEYSSPAKIAAGGSPIDVYGCPSPNFNDFDGDGDLDLICGEFLDSFTYFENAGSRSQPKYAAGRRLTKPDGARLAMDLEMIVPVAFDWDRDGDKDLIVGDEDGRVALVENSGQFTEQRVPIFQQPKYFQQQADTLKCGALATPFGVDWDNDGDMDIVSGNTAGYIELFQNLSGRAVAYPKWSAPVRLTAGSNVFRVQAGPNGSIQGPAEAKWGYTTLNVADWDGDELPDVIFNSILGKVQWLRNEGSRASPKLSPPASIEVQWNGPTPKPRWTWWRPTGKELATQWRTTPVVVDLTRDGLPDLVMLDHEGFLTLFERSLRDGQRILLPPVRSLCDEQGRPLQLTNRIAGGSGRRKLAVVDWDGDGILDLLLNSANADFYRGLGKTDGVWRFQNAGTLAKQNIEGHDVSPTVVDFDGNGVPDFLGGAEDGRFYLMRNDRNISRVGL